MHASTDISVYISVDISTDTRPMYRSTDRPSVGRYVDRDVSVDVSTDVSTEISGISFCFCATDLGSEKLTSVKKPCSGRVCTVGKLSSVGVQVTSSVLTDLGTRKPTSF